VAVIGVVGLVGGHAGSDVAVENQWGGCKWVQMGSDVAVIRHVGHDVVSKALGVRVDGLTLAWPMSGQSPGGLMVAVLAT